MRSSGKRFWKLRARLAPMQINKKGELQEWLEDWGQKEKSHRHISPLVRSLPGQPDFGHEDARISWPPPPELFWNSAV
jgi:hypothetical protein